MSTHSSQVLSSDEGEVRRWARGVSGEMWGSIAAGVIVALMVATAGAAMPNTVALAGLDAPVEIRVIESDLAEPFVVCTTRAWVTTCEELDLLYQYPT